MPTRIRVIGTSGSGKTRLARRLSHRLAVPYLELDALHHGPGWEPAPAEEFRAAVQRALERFESLHRGWIVAGNYPVVDDLLADADAIVWLDYPRRVVMWRVVTRSLGRMLLRTRLWHDNPERLRGLFSADPDKNIVLWAWTRYPTYRTQYAEAEQQDTERMWIRLRHPREADHWLATLQPREAVRTHVG